MKPPENRKTVHGAELRYTSGVVQSFEVACAEAQADAAAAAEGDALAGAVKKPCRICGVAKMICMFSVREWGLKKPSCRDCLLRQNRIHRGHGAHDVEER